MKTDRQSFENASSFAKNGRDHRDYFPLPAPCTAACPNNRRARPGWQRRPHLSRLDERATTRALLPLVCRHPLFPHIALPFVAYPALYVHADPKPPTTPPINGAQAERRAPAHRRCYHQGPHVSGGSKSIHRQRPIPSVFGQACGDRGQGRRQQRPLPSGCDQACGGRGERHGGQGPAAGSVGQACGSSFLQRQQTCPRKGVSGQKSGVGFQELKSAQ